MVSGLTAGLDHRAGAAPDPERDLETERWPREESNLRTRIRSPPLYPLSYGALDRRQSRLRRSIFIGYWASNRSVSRRKSRLRRSIFVGYWASNRNERGQAKPGLATDT